MPRPDAYDVLAALPNYVRLGGYLIIETFGAQGENWRALPRSREIPDVIISGYKTLAYEEKKVAKAADAVTARGLFQRPLD